MQDMNTLDRGGTPGTSTAYTTASTRPHSLRYCTPCADTGNGLEAVSPSVFADVLAATTGNGRDGVQLDIRDYGTISAAEVIKFRK